jgi:hypothetical protein
MFLKIAWNLYYQFISTFESFPESHFVLRWLRNHLNTKDTAS